jgi:heme oxygenase
MTLESNRSFSPRQCLATEARLARLGRIEEAARDFVLNEAPERRGRRWYEFVASLLPEGIEQQLGRPISGDEMLEALAATEEKGQCER